MLNSQILIFALLLIASSVASARVVKYKFNVGNYTVTKLCQRRVIVAVNKRLPGPTIRVAEGDTVIVDAINSSPYNMTLHWHGVFQLRTAWADGPSYVTQCPIQPGNRYRYKFNITGQEGTLWWHAHISFLRATIYGALIITPPRGYKLPFSEPHGDIPILLGEWWNANVVDVENQARASGGAPNVSDAYTINGHPGDQYPCGKKDMYKLKVVRGKTYRLRIINAALNNQLFFKIANHKLTVISADAAYTTPYGTDVVAIAPGQTTDVLLTANKAPRSYYMAASPYFTVNAAFDNTTTTAVIEYENSGSSTPIMPAMPAFNDTPTAHRFYSNITGRTGMRGYKVIPRTVDERMLITVGLNLFPCPGTNNATCAGQNNSRMAASTNGISFQLPTTLSLLQAYYNKVSGIYTTNYPNAPLRIFDYTNSTVAANFRTPVRGTRLKRLAYNTSVEIVFQNTAIVSIENHPMHIHGTNFFIMAMGFGNFNRTRDEPKFNLDNPMERNTVAVPTGGWAVIRFRATNPGVWLMHCHLDSHLTWGLAMAFIVENGPTPSTSLLPPPSDLPKC